MHIHTQIITTGMLSTASVLTKRACACLAAAGRRSSVEGSAPVARSLDSSKGVEAGRQALDDARQGRERTERAERAPRRRHSASPAGSRRLKVHDDVAAMLSGNELVVIQGAEYQTSLMGEYRRIHHLADLGLQEAEEVRSRLGPEQSGTRAVISVDERGLLLVNGCAAFRLCAPTSLDARGPASESKDAWYLFVYNRDRWLVGPVLGANDARLTAHEMCSLPCSVRSAWLEWKGSKWEVSPSIVCRANADSRRHAERVEVEGVARGGGFSYKGTLPLAAQSVRRYESAGSGRAGGRRADDDDYDSESSLSLRA